MTVVKLTPSRGKVVRIGPPRPVTPAPTEWRLKSGEMYSYRPGGEETFWLEKTGGRMIHGVASTGTVSSNKCSRDPKGCKVHLPTPLLFGHGFKEGTRKHGWRNPEDAAIGEVFYVRKTKHYVYVRAILHDTLAADAAWKIIKSGEARCFSVGTSRRSKAQLRGLVDGARFFSSWSLTEVSVCRRGANPDCFFDLWNGTDDVQDLTRSAD